jgi:ribosome-associated toxin RatA of RatAB toxin-antitoxin module
MRMSALLRVLLVLVVTAILAPSALTRASAASALASAQPEQLARGEVVLSAALPPGAQTGSMGGTATALVRATPDAVWRVLVDYRRHSGLYPRVVAADVLEDDQGRTLVRYALGVGPFSFRFHVNNYADAAHRRIDWHLADDRRNDLFRASTGYWLLEPDRDGVVLTYAMAARTVLPAFLTRGAERDGLVQTIKAVRERAEREPSTRDTSSAPGSEDAAARRS